MLKIQNDHHQQNGPMPTHFQQQREGAGTEEERTLHVDLAVNDPWHVPGIMRELVGGFDALAQLPPSVAVLGSSRAKPGDAELLLLSDDPREICSIVLAASQGRSRQEQTSVSYATHAMNHLEQVIR